jgi:transposase
MCSSLWTAPGRAWLAALDLPPTNGRSFRTAADCWTPWPPPLGRLEREIAALAKPDPRVQALQALPGIGRFPWARKLCAWAGLTPQVRNSDRTVRHGRITNQGSPWVRGILQEAAQTAKRHPLFADTYGQVARAAAATSPPWPSPGGCWPAASTF